MNNVTSLDYFGSKRNLIANQCVCPTLIIFTFGVGVWCNVLYTTLNHSFVFKFFFVALRFYVLGFIFSCLLSGRRFQSQPSNRIPNIMSCLNREGEFVFTGFLWLSSSKLLPLGCISLPPAIYWVWLWLIQQELIKPPLFRF